MTRFSYIQFSLVKRQLKFFSRLWYTVHNSGQWRHNYAYVSNNAGSTSGNRLYLACVSTAGKMRLQA